ncbi:DMT family transporter [Propionivibrio dicarboxylicus]|uniref:Threonine/homoserine efflux transporter RhtA n=1 Tax=Propionivibrio dicarboxylicus TaxID=83767 RepID=A0A1G7XW36_9RHOO|nr:DMT family transporter [Propionivibrio dicarboxylicus]SDG88422.1 Threonine/homoserine efflux transporter RhtA [Propionivibrio dicarboxylicus]
MSKLPAGTPKGILLVMTAVVFFSVGDLLAKQLTRDYPIPLIVWARFTFHLLFVIVALGPRHRLALFRTRFPGIQFLRGLMLLFGSIFFITALKYMPLAETTAIAYLAPILVTLMSVVFLKEKVDLGRWIAILCSFVGVLTIIRPGSSVFTWAVLLPIANALAFATYQILTRRIAGLESPYTSILYAGLVGSLLSLATLPDAWTLPKSPVHLLLFLGIGILGSAGHLILIKAYNHAPLSRLAPFSYSQLIWVAIIGYVVFDDFPDAWSLTGIAILLASGIYIAGRARQGDPVQTS